MIEDTNLEPGAIDRQRLCRQLVDDGTRTPDIVNGDNTWLEPIGGLVGQFSEVNGAEAAAVPGFVPIFHELFVLAKYWMTVVIDNDFGWLFCFQMACGSASRDAAFGNSRINRIAALIGEEAVQRAIDDAYEEYGRQHPTEAWRVYLHGTEDERRAFHEKCDAEEFAQVKEREENFYRNILKFVAGEPHDISEGSIEMAWAEIARALVKENPALVAPENKELLLKQIHDRDDCR